MGITNRDRQLTFMNVCIMYYILYVLNLREEYILTKVKISSKTSLCVCKYAMIFITTKKIINISSKL